MLVEGREVLVEGRGSRVVSVGSGGYYKNKIHAREN